MAKKTFKKYLPKVGGSAAVALAMTVALSSQAQATEMDHIDSLPASDLPPVDTSAESSNLRNSSEVEPTQANQAIEEANEDTIAKNNEIAENNEQTEQQNDESARKNETSTEGKLDDPNLNLPEAPEFTGTDNMNTDDYNDAVDEYNEGVQDYNDNVDEYNKDVDEYNTKADELDQQAQEQHKEELEDYEQRKEAADQAHQEKLTEYEKEKTEIEQANQDAQTAYDEKTATLSVLRDTEADPDSEAYKDAMATLAKYPEEYAQYLKDLAEYNQSVKDYDHYQDELEDYTGQTEALKALGEAEVGSAEYLAALEALAQYEEYKEYTDYLKQALADYNAEKETTAEENADIQTQYDTLMGLYNTLTAPDADPESAEYQAALAKLAEYPEYEEYLKKLEEHSQEVKDYSDYQDELKDYTGQTEALKALEEAEVGSAEYLAALEALAQYEEYEEYAEYLKQALADYNAEKEAIAKENAAAQTKYDTLMDLYNTLTTAAPESTEYQDALAKLAEYEEYQEYLNALNDFEKTEAERLQDYLDELDQYAKDKAEYENYETEKEIYDDVSGYNQQIEVNNGVVDNLNEALENDLHAGNVANIGEVSEINDNVNVEQTVLDTLNSHDDLAAQHQALLDAADALENHEGKGADLNSEAYAAYLAAVEAYNNDVTAFNEAVTAYNEAVAAYNAAVDAFNASQEDSSDSSTGNAAQQGDGKDVNWGNINIDGHSAGHVDVKYQAAASKDVIEENGNVTFSDSVTQYEVTGVYTDKNSAETNTDEYGLKFDNDGPGGEEGGVQELEKNEEYHEFSVDHGFGFGPFPGMGGFPSMGGFPGMGGYPGGQTGQDNHVDPEIDPAKGTISFYVTLEDGDGNPHGINVNLDANSVYADGSFYKAKFNNQNEETDFLNQFVFMNEDGKEEQLPVVWIANEEGKLEKYYDISGQSVFLISALTCDGMTAGRNNTLNPDGLDLILNLQTMIEIHQADNAEKISYLNYELGKTAQAESPTNPGDPGDPPDDFTPGTPPPLDEPTLKPENAPIWDPDAPADPVEPDVVDEPGDAPILDKPTLNLKNGPTWNPDAPADPVEPDVVDEPGLAPTAADPTLDLTEIDEPPTNDFNEAEPEAPTPTERLEHAEKLEELEKKVVVVIDPTPGPGPNPGPGPGPDPTPDPDPDPTPDPDPEPTPDPVEIPDDEVPLTELPEVEEELVEDLFDEEVPLSNIPKTGDASALFGAMSGFSALGLAVLQLLGRKKKDEE